MSLLQFHFLHIHFQLFIFQRTRSLPKHSPVNIWQIMSFINVTKISDLCSCHFQRCLSLMIFSPETLISSRCLSSRKFLRLLVNCCWGATVWQKQQVERPVLSSSDSKREKQGLTEHKPALFHHVYYFLHHSTLCISHRSVFCNIVLGVELTSDFFRLFRWRWIAASLRFPNQLFCSRVQARSSFPQPAQRSSISFQHLEIWFPSLTHNMSLCRLFSKRCM